MKFMSAFINHSLSPAKGDNPVQASNEAVSAVIAPSEGKQERVITDFSSSNREHSFSKNEQQSPFALSEQDIDSFTITSNKTAIEPQHNNSLVSEIPVSQVPFKVVSEGVKNTALDANKSGHSLHINPSINQAEAAKSPDNQEQGPEHLSTVNLENKAQNRSRFVEDLHAQASPQSVLTKTAQSNSADSQQTVMQSQLIQSQFKVEDKAQFTASNDPQSEPQIKADGVASKQQKSDKHSDNTVSINDQTQNIIEPIQAEPVFNGFEKTEQQTLTQSVQHQLKSALTDKKTEKIPQVRIGQVNVVIDDSLSKPKRNSTPSATKAANSFGLRGL